jgi:chemosensory pili system protein ChpA (sensor histidine kinase/response regulator)
MNQARKMVLIVEDDALLQKVLREGFEKIGFEVISAVDGVEAMARLAEKTPDIVLLDILLPRKDGFDVLQSIKKDPKTSKTPVVMISNLAGVAEIEKSKRLGASDYLVKANVSVEDVIAQTKELAEKKLPQ